MTTPLRAIPSSALWLDSLALPDHALRARVVRRAMADLGIEEGMNAKGAANNRSPYIDETMRLAGTHAGQPWCAAIARRWFDEAGAMSPPTLSAAVRYWVPWAQQHGLFKTTDPLPGDAVIYAMGGSTPNHMGVVVRVHTRGVRAVEGNTTYAGTSREGVAVVLKPIAKSLVVGYIIPRAKESA